MHYKKFAVYQKASIFVSYVIKELLVHAFSCAYIEKKSATPRTTPMLPLCSPNFRVLVYICCGSILSLVQNFFSFVSGYGYV